MMIKTEGPSVNIPSYVYCLIPYIHEKLKSEGSASAISLMSNLDLAALPAYVRGATFESARTDFHIKGIFGFDSFTNLMKLELIEHHYDSFESGLASINRSFAEGKAVILSGSSYHLPYFSDYHNPWFIDNFGYTINSTMYIVGNHWFSVYGIDESGVRIYDPIPSKFAGTIPMEDFRLAWGGNGLIAELAHKKDIEKCKAYGQLNVGVGHIFDQTELNDLFLSTAITTASLYLKGDKFNLEAEHCWFGHAALAEFISDLEQLAGDNRHVQRIEGCLYSMRVNRYQIGDLLHDMRKLGLIPQNILDAYLPLHRKWETTYNAFAINMARKKDDLIERTIVLLKEALDMEKHLFTLLYRYLKGTPFLARSAGRGE
ncbi:hypothetical protein PaecuDRAFT_0833 [Paenibacillus curdlanolyticus YK9]|uniref:Butirosin biosynthesis protein H N-terminal domain-containing protein n=1 Tax=Paenibacillus curdlanolyticus YK9 TaxID=717606 RepID=E0I5B1_9BACL|nr:hypothetical protein [Paenibacillus curdlanolyticus]EFM12153.1 hypothetical protein PaecuDRAFT_0833 [Paenibacillus curdlanolyticus YK9]